MMGLVDLVINLNDSMTKEPHLSEWISKKIFNHFLFVNHGNKFRMIVFMCWAFNIKLNLSIVAVAKMFYS